MYADHSIASCFRRTTFLGLIDALTRSAFEKRKLSIDGLVFELRLIIKHGPSADGLRDSFLVINGSGEIRERLLPLFYVSGQLVEPAKAFQLFV